MEVVKLVLDPFHRYSKLVIMKNCHYLLYYCQVITSSKTDPAALSVFNVSSMQWIRVQVEADYRIPSLRSATQMTSAAVGVYMFGGMDEK